MHFLKRLLASYKDEETKILVNDYIYNIYNLIVIVSSDLYNISADVKFLNSAFEFIEKGKTAVLLASIREMEAIEIDNIPVSIRKKEKDLKKEISLLQTFINDESQKSSPDSSKIEGWKKRIFNKNLSYDSLIVAIEKNFPEYYNLKYSAEVANVKEIQDKLKSKKY